MANRLRMKISEYRRRYFAPGSEPLARTVVGQIRRGELVGERVGKLWYVYPDEKPTKAQRIAAVIAEFERRTLL